MTQVIDEAIALQDQMVELMLTMLEKIANRHKQPQGQALTREDLQLVTQSIVEALTQAGQNNGAKSRATGNPELDTMVQEIVTKVRAQDSTRQAQAAQVGQGSMQALQSPEQQLSNLIVQLRGVREAMNADKSMYEQSKAYCEQQIETLSVLKQDVEERVAAIPAQREAVEAKREGLVASRDAAKAHLALYNPKPKIFFWMQDSSTKDIQKTLSGYVKNINKEIKGADSQIKAYKKDEKRFEGVIKGLVKQEGRFEQVLKELDGQIAERGKQYKVQLRTLDKDIEAIGRAHGVGKTVPANRDPNKILKGQMREVEFGKTRAEQAAAAQPAKAVDQQARPYPDVKPTPVIRSEPEQARPYPDVKPTPVIRSAPEQAVPAQPTNISHRAAAKAARKREDRKVAGGRG